jgi:hypothetical protein
MTHFIVRFTLAVAVATLMQSGSQALGQEFQLQVRHDHLLASCKGELIINRDGVEYRTTTKQDARNWSYTDIKMIKLGSPKEIGILTFESSKMKLGRDREFEFKLLNGEVSKEVSDFLLAYVKRPIADSVFETEGAPKYEIPVRHRHTFGGEQGVLKIYDDRVEYQSRKAESSRYWRWTDIQGISRMGPYRFSITTFEPMFGGPTKTFNFDLKERMGDEEYDYLWSRVNKISLPASSN